MTDHPVRACVAEIMVAHAGKRQTRGSGYLVSPGWVLTACHVVNGAASIGVWLGAPLELTPRARLGVDTGLVLMVPAADLALLPVTWDADDPPFGSALFGRLDRNAGAVMPAAAAGCPRFKLRPNPARPDMLLRELYYASGSIAPLSNAKSGRYEFAVEVLPGPDPDPEHSPWEGMSGAAVWGGGRLIGVVGQHYPREGFGILTVRPIAQLFDRDAEAELEAWRQVLPQLPPTEEDLWLATPPKARMIVVGRARRAAEALAPQVLIGRGDELAALQAFSGSDTRWRWLQGDAFAGKTALLAWFALHPPDRIDVVACFLRRTTGDNTADYALDVLTRQLALLADRRGYLPPPFLSERAHDLVDLLDEAARACAERGRRLLVLIDGLDEYDPTTTSLDLPAWLPSASTLPLEAMLMVASRAGADIRVPLPHPLRYHVQPITASEAATEVRHAARAELERALTTPGGLIFPLVCCLAVADSGLTSGELRVLLRRRGRDADVGEIEALLGRSLGRSLIRLPDHDGGETQVHVFAHDSLLAEARALLAADLTTYEDLFDAWAGDYAQRDWPIDTPRYLLRPYTRELARRARDPATPDLRCQAAVDQLFMVVTQHHRLVRLFERTGNPAVPDRDIVAAQHTTVDTRSRSGLDADEVVFRLAVLALRRRPLTGARVGVATRIAVVWARLGRGHAATDLAAGIGVPKRRAEALSKVAVVLAEIGQPGSALRAVAEIDDRERHAEALSRVAATLARGDQSKQAAEAAGQALQAATEIDAPERPMLGGVAVALAGAGQAGPALKAAAEIDDPERRAETLSKVAVALDRAGQAEQASEAVGKALQAAARIYVPWRRTEVLSKLAEALAGAGQAESATQAITDIVPWRRAETLSKVAVALARAGQLGPALQAAAGINDAERRAEALSKVAAALARAGLSEQATEAAGQALQAATEIDDSEQSAEALSKVAAALARACRSKPPRRPGRRCRPQSASTTQSDARRP